MENRQRVSQVFCNEHTELQNQKQNSLRCWERVMLFVLKCEQRDNMEEVCLLKNPIKETRVEIETDSGFLHLKDFLSEDADNYIQEQIASVYWLYIDDVLRGYMSLSVSVCKVDDEYWQNKIWDWESPKFPWILIGRLLIDKKLTWQWHGRKFITLAVSIGNELSKLVWLRCLIVDANQEAVVFYEKMWFIEISWTRNAETVKMILDLQELYC